VTDTYAPIDRAPTAVLAEAGPAVARTSHRTYLLGVVTATVLLLALIPLGAGLQRAAIRVHVADGHAATSNAYLCVDLVGWCTIALAYAVFRRLVLGTDASQVEPRPWIQVSLLCPTVTLHVYVASRWSSLAVDRPMQLACATVIPPAALWLAPALVRAVGELRPPRESS